MQREVETKQDSDGMYRPETEKLIQELNLLSENSCNVIRVIGAGQFLKKAIRPVVTATIVLLLSYLVPSIAIGEANIKLAIHLSAGLHDLKEGAGEIDDNIMPGWHAGTFVRFAPAGLFEFGVAYRNVKMRITPVETGAEESRTIHMIHIPINTGFRIKKWESGSMYLGVGFALSSVIAFRDTQVLRKQDFVRHIWSSILFMEATHKRMLISLNYDESLNRIFEERIDNKSRLRELRLSIGSVLF